MAEVLGLGGSGRGCVERSGATVVITTASIVIDRQCLALYSRNAASKVAIIHNYYLLYIYKQAFGKTPGRGWTIQMFLSSQVFKWHFPQLKRRFA